MFTTILRTRNACLVVLLSVLGGCASPQNNAPAPANADELCGTGWAQNVENHLHSGDNQGHGPDIGSQEWQSTIEFRLGVRGKPDTPALTDPLWCRYIDKQIDRLKHTRASKGPAFSCAEVRPASMEALICERPELGALDREMQRVFDAALAGQHAPQLRAVQRGWIKGRNECWKANDHQACIRQAYIDRIAELKAQHHLVDN